MHKRVGLKLSIGIESFKPGLKISIGIEIFKIKFPHQKSSTHRGEVFARSIGIDFFNRRALWEVHRNRRLSRLCPDLAKLLSETPLCLTLFAQFYPTLLASSQAKNRPLRLRRIAQHKSKKTQKLIFLT